MTINSIYIKIYTPFCGFHATSDIEGSKFLLVFVQFCLPDRITSSAEVQCGRGPGSGVYVKVKPVA